MWLLYKKALLCYNLFWSLLASWFLSDPCFIRQITSFILRYMFVILHCTRNVRVWFTHRLFLFGNWGWCSHVSLFRGRKARSRRWQKHLRWFFHKIILDRDLLCSSKAQYQVPVWFPFPQGTEYISFSYPVVVQPRDRDFDPDINPAMYVWNGFLEFFYHELTQICEYDDGHITKNFIHWEEKGRKMFLLITEFLTLFIFIFLLPLSQEIYLRFLHVGVFVQVSKSDVDYGVSLDFP